IDLRALEDLRRYQKKGVADYADHVVGLFLSDLTPRVKTVRENLSDREQISRIAHSLKSTSGLIGARNLSALCGRLEETAERGEDIQDLVQQFLTECERVRLALDGRKSGALSMMSGPTGLDAEGFFEGLEAELAEHPALHHSFLQRFRSERLSRQQL